MSQGYNFPVGEITVQGKQALAYVRERKQLPRGDLERAERQRLVVQAVLGKGMSKDVLLNPVAFNRFVGGLASTVTVDQQLTTSELRKTALSIRFPPTPSPRSRPPSPASAPPTPTWSWSWATGTGQGQDDAGLPQLSLGQKARHRAAVPGGILYAT